MLPHRLQGLATRRLASLPGRDSHPLGYATLPGRTKKQDLTPMPSYATRADAEASIKEYIEIFYNRQRRHSSLGNLAPAVFARHYTQQGVA